MTCMLTGQSKRRGESLKKAVKAMSQQTLPFAIMSFLMQFFLCVCPYRLPAVPLHRAVVVFHHPGMVQQLSDSQTPLWVHLQDTYRNYNSTCTKLHSPQSVAETDLPSNLGKCF